MMFLRNGSETSENSYNLNYARKTRNLSEKRRRDQFNILVNELNSMISTSTRKLDKSSVLKSTITFLRNQNEIAVRSRVNEIQEDWKPPFLSNEEFTHLILEAVDGFIIVFTSSGRIKYASESITSLLGYLPSDILNTSLYDITFDADKSILYNLLQGAINSDANRCEINDSENQVMFSCHLKRECLEHQNDPIFELVKFSGYYRSKEAIQNFEMQYGIDTESESHISAIFICTGKLETPQLIRDMTLIDTSKNEFTSRHSLEWKFLYLDHRASPIIGYLPFEVLGTSGYDYYHFDDLDKVVLCHEALMLKGEGISCYYRFLTKGQQWIWLQTRFYITYHQWNSKPEFIVCTHRVVRYQDVVRNKHRGHEYFNMATPTPEGIADRFYDRRNNQIATHTETNGYNYQWDNRTTPAVKYYQPNADPNNAYKRNYSDTASMSAESVSSHKSSNHQNSCSVIMRAGSSGIQNNPCLNKIQQSEGISQQQQQQQQRQLLPQQPNILPEQQLNQYHDQRTYIAPQSTPAPNAMQKPSKELTSKEREQEQRRHEELKELIKIQKEELRRVSEQLLMARYGLLPPIINVAVPFNGILHAENSGTWPETSEPYVQPGYHPTLPTPINPGEIITQPNLQQIPEQGNYIPMPIPIQMSQHQAQVLFTSATDNNNVLSNNNNPI